VDRLFTKASFLCVPSLHEGFGMVYLEAMERGLPCIGSASGGAAEIIREGIDGFLIAPGDVRGLEEKLTEMAADPARRAEMAENALDRAAQFPDWKESMLRVEKFLSRVVASQ
jgi:glycosyltransferase involved in cell wall biosynthesis